MLPLKGKKLAYVLFALSVISGFVQIAMGASLETVFWCLFTIAAGLFAFSALGAYNVGAWIALFFSLGNGIVALYSKTFLS